MKLRIFIYKPGEALRQSLSEFIESLGHEAAVVNFPQTCLQYHSPDDTCSTRRVCADMIILGRGIPPGEGLSMLEKRTASGCLGVKHNAIICDALTDEERLRAEKIGCKCFEASLDLQALGKWLGEVGSFIDRERELSPFTIGGTSESLAVSVGE